MGTPLKCFQCGGEGHFVRECPSSRNTNGGNAGIGNSASAPSTPKYWTPRRNVGDDQEEKEFLRELVNERREEKARKKELEDQKRFDERLRIEMAKFYEATKAEVMAAVGRQYLTANEEARREEQRRGWSPPPRRREDFRSRDESDMDVDDLEAEIRRLAALRDRKRKGKEAVRPEGNFRQPSFMANEGTDGSKREREKGEFSSQGGERRKKKIPAGLGPEGLLQFVLDQKRELSGLKQDELKRICSREGLRYCTKGPSIDQIIEARTKLAYESFVFSPAPSAPGSPEVDQAPSE
ncbi:hypothetical protein CBR_g10985 [Chara braunii]|uniref:CCHC-type domain-containing protein n=1 Tax=Chara braunii TaxID=69332 RepID=A0A388KPR7_CHABU|nr:hypothetical protein CBR_g10985 [Chara braunii]|eukprot:GBG72051.1 hypothetical protein CBR_g10985 [Chara braunii]